ncbi:hypothetical protein DM860_014452 [Cuscuta australis]|uniref:Uncharacterized protein n=1 Tax=Cuscuta australis TaxID=267555 RepID=A0A328DZ54_9ASTE|nr:hypothetical protein DM860_014452 [Cuscuta australis]
MRPLQKLNGIECDVKEPETERDSPRAYAVRRLPAIAKIGVSPSASLLRRLAFYISPSPSRSPNHLHLRRLTFAVSQSRLPNRKKSGTGTHLFSLVSFSVIHSLLLY